MARKRPPARTLEAREQQLVSLAVDLAEKQLEEGTATPSVIVHYLKLGTTQYELEREKLRCETELIQAKRDNLRSQANLEEIWKEALEQLRVYQGVDDGEPIT